MKTRLGAFMGALVIVFAPAVGRTGANGLRPWECGDTASCLILCENFCGGLFSGKVVVGLPGSDNLQGGPLDDCIVGNGGNDRITGNQGNDCIITSDGNDTVTGGSGDDALLDFGGNNPRLLGEAGNDAIVTGAACIFGFQNLSFIDACGGDDVIAGGSGDDFILDVGGNNSILGEQGNDFIAVVNDQGSSQHSLVVGGSGSDFIQTQGGNHTLRGEGDNDNLSAFDNVSNLDGGSGNDSCQGGAIQTSCNP